MLCYVFNVIVLVFKLGESEALAERLQEDAKQYALEKQRMEVRINGVIPCFVLTPPHFIYFLENKVIVAPQG